MPPSYREDPEILRAALVGCEHSLSVIEQRIAELRSHLGGRSASSQVPGAPAGAHGGIRRVLSAAARDRIALAQKKRWAAYKAGQGKSATPAKPAAPKAQKRQLSAEGRAHIVAATKKRWAAFRKAQQAAKASPKSPAKKAGTQKAAKSAAPAGAPQVVVTANPAGE